MIGRWRDSHDIEPKIDLEIAAYVVRDTFDRAAKAAVLFDDLRYAQATVALIRRALAPSEPARDLRAWTTRNLRPLTRATSGK